MKKIFATVSRNSILAHDPCLPGLYDFEEEFGRLPPDAPVPLLACLESNLVADVIWALRAVHQDISGVIPLIAADFAESILPIFEKAFPDDDRPRKAIEAARSGKNGEEAASAAWAAESAASEAISHGTSAALAAIAARDAASSATCLGPYAAADTTLSLANTVYSAVADASTIDAMALERSKQAEILRKYFSETETDTHQE